MKIMNDEKVLVTMLIYVEDPNARSWVTPLIEKAQVSKQVGSNYRITLNITREYLRKILKYAYTRDGWTVDIISIVAI